MKENKENLLSEEQEEELLRALAAQAPAEEYTATAGEPLPKGSLSAPREDIVNALKTVSDPEIPINIYDMGFVYDIRQQEDGDVEIDMTLTAPTCPVAGILPQQAADAVAALCGVGRVTVKVVWEPAWTPDKMSEDAKAVLELF